MKKPNKEQAIAIDFDQLGKRITFECLCCSGVFYTEVEDRRKKFDGWFIENKTKKGR